MNLNLKNQITVVAGGANGIGQAIARAFAQEGSDVVLLDRDPDVTEIVMQLKEIYQVNSRAWVLDVTDYANTQKIAGQIEQDLGPVDHLVYTVGVNSGKTGFPFWNVEPHEWEPVYRINLQGAVHTIYAFIQPMIARQRGTVLFLASVAGQIGSQTDPPYSAAKAALINFAQCAAKDLAPYNIRVNALNPGLVDTKLQQAIWATSNHHLPPAERPDYEAWAAEKLQRVVPLNRWQTPEDIANMAVFLASEKARNVTGQSVNVDGGFVMHS